MLKGKTSSSVGNSPVDCLYKYIVVLCICSGIFTKIWHLTWDILIWIF